MQFNKEAHIARMKPAVDKLVNHLQKKGVSFQPNDENLENVILSSAKKTIKISHHSFYRYSGIAVIYSKTSENTFDITEITDEMFLTNYMKPIIEMHFELK